jgi:transcriptional regulator with XRE-family HTH domain
MSFAQWVKDTREEQNMSITECATRAGVKHPTWIEYENTTKGKQPRRETVEKVATGLRVPLSVALEAAGFATKTVDVPARLAESWNKLRNAPRHKQDA